MGGFTKAEDNKVKTAMRNRFGHLLAAAVMMAALAVPSAMAQATGGGMQVSKPGAMNKEFKKR